MKIKFVKFVPLMAVLLTSGLGTACTELDSAGPFFTTPPRFYNEKGVTQNVSAVSVCYNSAIDTPKQITELVLTACTNPTFLRSDYLGECPLAQPVRGTYLCEKVDATIASAPPFPKAFKSGTEVGFKTKTGG